MNKDKDNFEMNFNHDRKNSNEKYIDYNEVTLEKFLDILKETSYVAKRVSGIDMEIEINESANTDAQGYQILWGESTDKLYHSCLTYEKKKRIGALVDGRKYCVRLDSFNECGITEG